MSYPVKRTMTGFSEAGCLDVRNVTPPQPGIAIFCDSFLNSTCPEVISPGSHIVLTQKSLQSITILLNL